MKGSIGAVLFEMQGSFRVIFGRIFSPTDRVVMDFEMDLRHDSMLSVWFLVFWLPKFMEVYIMSLACNFSYKGFSA